MKERKIVTSLILIMSTISLTVVISSSFWIYGVHKKEKFEILREVVQSKARHIEAVAQYDKDDFEKHPKKHSEYKTSKEATLFQIANAHSNYKGFGDTGEFTLAERRGEKIVYMLPLRHEKDRKLKVVNFNEKISRPMRRALSGESGIITALDYRDEEVMAAYEPIKFLNMGLVAKIDLKEIRGPFIKAGLFAFFLTLVLVLTGSFLFFKLTNPLLNDLKKLSVAVENAPASVVITDEKGRIKNVNKKFESITGYSLLEVKGKNPRILSTGKTPKETYKNLWDTVLSGRTWEGTLYNKKKNGDIYIEKAAISPILDSKNKITNYVAVKEDITEKVNAEKKIREQNEFLNKIINSLNHPFSVINASTYEVELANSALTDKDLGKGVYCYELMHNYDKPCSEVGVFCPMGKVIETKKEVVCEHVHNDKEGKEHIYEVHAHPILGEDGSVKSVIDYSIDITDRKELEKEKDEIIAKKVAANSKLAELGLLSAGLGHELKNPLTVIQASTDYLEGYTKSKDEAECIEAIYASVDKMVDYIERLKTYAKPKEKFKTKVKLNHLIDYAFDMFGKQVINSGVDIIKNYSDDESVEIFGDRNKLEQIFVNIITNSWHAMKESNTKEIRVKTLKQDNNVRVLFEDTGCGIPKENQDKIFENFFTTKKEGEGTGLGMSIVKDIVKEHYGDIKILKSIIGKGTTFEIIFPKSLPTISKRD